MPFIAAALGDEIHLSAGAAGETGVRIRREHTELFGAFGRHRNHGRGAEPIRSGADVLACTSGEVSGIDAIDVDCGLVTPGATDLSAQMDAGRHARAAGGHGEGLQCEERHRAAIDGRKAEQRFALNGSSSSGVERLQSAHRFPDFHFLGYCAEFKLEVELIGLGDIQRHIFGNALPESTGGHRDAVASGWQRGQRVLSRGAGGAAYDDATRLVAGYNLRARNATPARIRHGAEKRGR